MHFRKAPTIFLCLLLNVYMGLSIDIVLPSLPSITQHFKQSIGHTQLIISLFIVVFAIALVFLIISSINCY